MLNAVLKEMKYQRAQFALAIKQQMAVAEKEKEREPLRRQDFSALPFANSNSSGPLRDTRLSTLQEILDFEEKLKGSASTRKQFVSFSLL